MGNCLHCDTSVRRCSVIYTSSDLTCCHRCDHSDPEPVITYGFAESGTKTHIADPADPTYALCSARIFIPAEPILPVCERCSKINFRDVPPAGPA